MVIDSRAYSMRCHRKCEARVLRTIASFAALAIALAFPVTSSIALSIDQPPQRSNNTTSIAAERRSSASEQSWITYHVDMPKGASFREQHIHQEVLAALLMDSASRLPGVAPCGLKVRFLDGFGDFAVEVNHPNPTRRNR